MSGREIIFDYPQGRYKITENPILIQIYSFCYNYHSIVVGRLNFEGLERHVRGMCPGGNFIRLTYGMAIEVSYTENVPTTGFEPRVCFMRDFDDPRFTHVIIRTSYSDQCVKIYQILKPIIFSYMS